MKNKPFVTILTLWLASTSIHAEDPSSSDKNNIILLPIKQENLSNDYIKNAKINLKNGHYRKAHKLIINAIEIDKKIYGYTHQQTATDFSLLAHTLFLQDHHTRAKAFFLKSQEIRKKLFPKNDIILTDNLFGLALIEKAQAKYNVALSKQKSILKKRNNSNTNNNVDIARSLLEIANLEITLANFSKAELNISRAEEITTKNIGSDHPLNILLLRQKSLLETEKGNFSIADKHDKIILEKQIKSLGRNNVLVAATLSNIANRMINNKKSALALPLLRESQTIYHTEFGPQSLKFATNLSHIASANLKLGAYVKAKEMNNRSSSITKKILINNKHPLIAINLINQAKYLAAKKKYNESNQSFLDAQIIFETVYGSQHPKVAQLIAERADILMKQKQFSKAKTHYLKAINILKSYFKENNPLLLTVSEKYKNFIDNEPQLEEVIM